MVDAVETIDRDPEWEENMANGLPSKVGLPYAYSQTNESYVTFKTSGPDPHEVIQALKIQVGAYVRGRRRPGAVVYWRTVPEMTRRQVGKGHPHWYGYARLLVTHHPEVANTVEELQAFRDAAYHDLVMTAAFGPRIPA